MIEEQIAEEIIEAMDKKKYQPMRTEELMHFMGVPKKEKEAFSKTLRNLERQGRLVVTKKKRYALPKHMGLIRAKLQGHARGFGFAVPFDEEEKAKGDLFIAPHLVGGAMDQDQVLVKEVSSDRKGKREGRVERVVIRENRTLIGTYQKSKHYGFLVPDNMAIGRDVYIRNKHAGGAKSKQKVVAKIIKWPEGDKAAEGEIVEILGFEGDPGVDILSIIKSYGLPLEFPAEVQEAAASLPQSIQEKKGQGQDKRQDLRDQVMVTIDGEDAKDIDDAVSLSLDKEGRFHLGVHIADVSHYVKEGSLIEKEALERATSVYLPDRVIPMLPLELSNGICSLNEGVDRYAMSCSMVIDGRGKVVSKKIGPSLIRVDKRLTYKAVTELLDHPDQATKALKPYRELLVGLSKVQAILKKKRFKRGAIGFDFPEIKVIMNEDGSVKGLEKREGTLSESIIEECMIVANETVAEYLHDAEIPAIYRVHEEPSLEKVDRLNNILAKYGLKVDKKGESIHPRVFAKLMEEIKGQPYQEELSIMLLRSMMHARYLADPVGHFGLASTYYAHFTAPIRRFPDLFVHRAIRRALGGKLSEEKRQALRRRADLVAAKASDQELVAEQAEREATDLKVVEYMSSQVGEVYKATVSGVIASGFFVRLDNLAEGLVRVANLRDDFYEYDENQGRLVGQRTKKTYKMGDPVYVQLVRADTALRQLDFEVITEKSYEKHHEK